MVRAKDESDEAETLQIAGLHHDLTLVEVGPPDHLHPTRLLPRKVRTPTPASGCDALAFELQPQVEEHLAQPLDRPATSLKAALPPRGE
jgi:hypothetical protein